MFFRKNSHGVITVFISLMLVSVLSLGTLVVEVARYQSAKTQLAEANISVSTSMVANYDVDLYKRYGLLAVKSSDIDEAKAMDYLNYNSDLASNAFGNNISRQYSISSIDVKGMYNLTYPSVLKRQILSRAKYSVVVQDYALNRYNADQLLSQFQTECNYVTDALYTVGNGSGANDGDVPDDVKKALENMSKAFDGIQTADTQNNVVISDNSFSILPSQTGVVETQTPEEDLDLINDAKDSVSSLIGTDASTLFSQGTSFSQTDVNVGTATVGSIASAINGGMFNDSLQMNGSKNAAMCVAQAKKMNAAINTLKADQDGTLLLNSYITDFFSSRNRTVKGYVGPGKGSGFTGENGNFASACVEYIFGGSKNEMTNQDTAFKYLMAVRLIDNLYLILNTSKSFNPNSTTSAWAHIMWAYYESFADVQLMARYNCAVPFSKTQLIFDINSPASVASAFSTYNFVTAMEALGIYSSGEYSVPGANKFSYLDYMSFSLWFVANSTKLSRVSDLIQLEMRYNQQYVNNTAATFLMSDMDTYCRIKVNAKLNSVLPVISSNQGGSIQNVRFSSTKYSGF